MRFLFAPLRAVLLILHILLGLFLVFAVFPFCSQPQRNAINHIWSRWVLRLCGAQLRVSGQPISAELARTGITPGLGRLLLANHVSWIDIFAINAAMTCRFVAKAEIGRWPIVGNLVTRSGSLYIERGRRRAVAHTNHIVQQHLRAGESIVVFPEGTTTCGDRLLPFHSNLLAPAIEVGCDVWPVGLAYRERGERSDCAAFIGDMGLVTSLINVLLADRLEIEVAYLPALPASARANRHVLARTAHSVLSAHFGFARESQLAEESEEVAA